MRIWIKLHQLQNYSVNFQYHHKVQGFFYSLLRNTGFEDLHDKRGYKFFCFSNIFKTSSDQDNFNLIISSPSEKFISQVGYQLQKIIDNLIPVEIGSLFELISIRKMNQNYSFPLKLVTESPIITRILLVKYQGYQIDSAPHSSIYWRSSHPLELFIGSIEQNMQKKYLEFSGNSISIPLFEKYKFKKQVSTKIEVGSSKVPVIGSLWELEFASNVPQQVQRFVLDCGVGERNSLGFGFVNPITPKRN